MIFSDKTYVVPDSRSTSKISIMSEANACLMRTPWPGKTNLQMFFIEYCSGFGAAWKKTFPVTLFRLRKTSFGDSLEKFLCAIGG